jgi:hypothetical protein
MKKSASRANYLTEKSARRRRQPGLSQRNSNKKRVAERGLGSLFNPEDGGCTFLLKHE